MRKIHLCERKITSNMAIPIYNAHISFSNSIGDVRWLVAKQGQPLDQETARYMLDGASYESALRLMKVWQLPLQSLRGHSSIRSVKWLIQIMCIWLLHWIISYDLIVDTQCFAKGCNSVRVKCCHKVEYRILKIVLRVVKRLKT